jgi:hypothetical protein
MSTPRLERLKRNSNNITKFDIYPNGGGEQISLLKGITEVYYYENILSPTISVQISVTTTGYDSPADDGSGAKINFADKIKSGSGEKVFLEFEDGLGQKISFATDDRCLRLNNNDKLPETAKSASYIMELVSEEYLTNETARVLERYDGPISESVRRIFQNTLKTKKELDIEFTQNSYSFIGTNKKPFWTITWLAKQSVPNIPNSYGKTAGYFFFETRRGFNYKSIDGLFDKKVYKKLIYNKTSSAIVPVGYDGKILEYNDTDNGDLKEQLKIGAYASTTNLFNTFESVYNCNPINWSDQIGIVKTLGTDYGKDINFKFTESSRIFQGNVTLGNMFSVEKSKEPVIEKEKILSQSNSRYNQVFKIVLKIKIAGDFSLQAGDLLYCDFQEISSKKTVVPNSRLSGLYMISALCHHINRSPLETITSLELVRDSYGRKPK